MIVLVCDNFSSKVATVFISMLTICGCGLGLTGQKLRNAMYQHQVPSALIYAGCRIKLFTYYYQTEYNLNSAGQCHSTPILL